MARIDQQVARMIYRSQQQEATVALIEQLDLCDGQHLPLKGSSLPGNIVNSEQIETADQALTDCHTPVDERLNLEGEEGQVAAVKGKPTVIRQSQLRTVIEPSPTPSVTKKRVHYAPLPTQSKSAQQLVQESYVKPRAARSKTSSHEALPPTYFAAHLLSCNTNPLHPEEGVSLVAKVDSGCTPFSIISDALVQQARLPLEPRPTRLRTANIANKK